MDALIGRSGLVGGTILHARPFDAMFRSTDIETMRGSSWDLVVCAGVRAEKWRANADPEADTAGIARLTNVLATLRIAHLVLISTVDVYPAPSGVDESTAIAPNSGHAYGRHRLALEAFCTERFPCTVVRLPGLFGSGLKKNAIFDLLHENAVEKIHPESAFQFYDLSRLWADIERIRAAELRLANLVSEPVRMADVANQVFGRDLTPTPGTTTTRYDVQSRHASRFGGHNGYWYSAADVHDRIKRFVADERARQARSEE